jgi:NADPH:quinone reductase-like Zn-dependent oxidoreductase
MRAIVQERYGAAEDVLCLQEISAPEVRSGDVLVRVRATSVAGDDWHLVRGIPYVARLLSTGVAKPKQPVPGRELAGTVEAVGDGVTSLVPGNEVFGWCHGAFAERALTAEDALCHKPANASFEASAATPTSAVTALQALRDAAQVRVGQQVLIIGASGGVGTFAVQVGKWLGARVTGVCSAGTAELVRSLGADAVIDYTNEDFTRDRGSYDVIVDLVGKHPLSAVRQALAPDGTLVLVGGSGGRWFNGTDRWARAVALSPFVRQRLRPLVHAERRADLLLMKELIEAGKITPIVSTCYSLADAAHAVQHVEKQHTRGKVVLSV